MATEVNLVVPVTMEAMWHHPHHVLHNKDQKDNLANLDQPVLQDRKETPEDLATPETQEPQANKDQWDPQEMLVNLAMQVQRAIMEQMRKAAPKVHQETKEIPEMQVNQAMQAPQVMQVVLDHLVPSVHLDHLAPLAILVHVVNLVSQAMQAREAKTLVL